jgi:epoxyqueuosine reductase
MTLKTDFFRFVQDELQIPLVGIASSDDYSQEDVKRISFVVKTFAQSTPLAEGNDAVLQPRDFLPEARSVIVLGTPSYMGEIEGFEECRKELLGRVEPSHVNVKYLQVSSEKSYRISEFFTSRGFQCFSLIGGQFPLKLMASKCGVGYYGKNAIIQHPDFGSWISLSAYVTDAELEPDNPLEGDCGKCELCLSVCPTGAIFAPYRCDVTRCLDFQLGHNKKEIPVEIREKSGNLMGEGCTTCRDICPKNRKLKPIEGFDTPRELLHPSLVKVFDITDDEWESSFATTLMGFFLMDKMYLKRNAAIGLGNFKDERGLDSLARFLKTGEDEVRGYAAWAIGNIGGGKAEKILKSSLDKEENREVTEEIEAALEAV